MKRWRLITDVFLNFLQRTPVDTEFAEVLGKLVSGLLHHYILYAFGLSLIRKYLYYAVCYYLSTKKCLALFLLSIHFLSSHVKRPIINNSMIKPNTFSIIGMHFLQV